MQQEQQVEMVEVRPVLVGHGYVAAVVGAGRGPAECWDRNVSLGEIESWLRENGYVVDLARLTTSINPGLMLRAVVERIEDVNARAALLEVL